MQQECSKSLLNIFMSDSFTNLLAAGEKGRGILVPLCKGLEAKTDLGSGNNHILDEVASVANLSPVSEAIASITKICLAVRHIFNEEGAKKTTMADVIWFVDYTGHLLLEKTVKSIFKQEGGFWKKQVDELIEKGATSAMLKPKLDEMHFLLSKLVDLTDLQMTLDTSDLLIKMNQLFKDLRGGIRAVELEGISDKFSSLIQKLVTRCMSQKDAGDLTGEAMTVLMIGLDQFTHLPGVLSQLKDFKGWVATNKAVLSVNTLLQFIDQSTSTNLDFEKVKSLVSQIPKDADTDVPQGIPTLVRHMLDSCLTQASFLNMGRVWK